MFDFSFKEGLKKVRVRVLASHQCGPGSSLGGDAISGSNLFVLLHVLAPRGFSNSFRITKNHGFSNSSSIRKQCK